MSARLRTEAPSPLLLDVPPDRLEALADQGIGPAKVKGDLTVTARGKGTAVAGKLDRATEAMFDGIMSKPTNWLSRSVSWKQLYWQRAEELMPFMDDAAKRATLEAAVEANPTRAPASLAAEDRARLQRAMIDAGVIRKGAKVRLGVWDDTSRKRLRRPARLRQRRRT